MSYIINKTDGSILTEIVDGNIDQISSDLTLIGKNANAYGEFINENFVFLLENFANTSSPNNPIMGQLWYDTSEGRLKVYDGSGFKVSGGTVVSPTRPTNLTTGDIWIDSSNQQFHFNDGTNTVLVGPLYTTDQGLSGFYVEDILDSNNIKRTIVKFYVAQELIGIFSKEAFTPLETISNFDGDVVVGFKSTTYQSNNQPVIFDITATKARSLITSDGDEVLPNMFITTDTDSYITGSLFLQNNAPITLGSNQTIEMFFDEGKFFLSSLEPGQDVVIKITNSAQISKEAICISASNERVGIYTNNPSEVLDVNGNIRAQGNLLVDGASSMPLGLSAITTGLNNAQIASTLITKVYPVAEHLENTICRIICNDSVTNTVKEYKLSGGTWVWQSDL